MAKCLSKELADYFNSGYRALKGETSIVMHLNREEKKLIRELLGNLSIDPGSKCFDFDEQVRISLQLMTTSLHEVHPLFAKVFRQLCVPYLPDYEKNVRDILTSHQDHIVHSVYLYILGLYLADQLKTFKNDHINYIRNDLIFAERDDAIFGSIDRREFESYKRPSFALKEFLLRWKITAFFHDTAYPAEISSKLMEHWFEDILDKERQGDSSKLLTYRLNVIDRYFKLEIPQNPSWPFPNLSRIETDIFFIFSQRLSHLFFPDLQVETIKDILYENFYKMALNQGFVEHGFFSALIFTYMLHLRVKDEAKRFSDQTKHCSGKRKDFYSKRYELTSLYLRGIDAATAILLHNLQHFKHPAFKDKKIESREYPLAFMLKLCDELQMWNRYKGDIDKNISHKKLESLRDIVGDELSEFDSLGKYSQKRYLKLVMEEKTFCIDEQGKIRINPEKVRDKVLRKLLLKLFSINPKDKISEIETYIRELSEILQKNEDVRGVLLQLFSISSNELIDNMSNKMSEITTSIKKLFKILEDNEVVRKSLLNLFPISSIERIYKQSKKVAEIKASIKELSEILENNEIVREILLKIFSISSNGRISEIETYIKELSEILENNEDVLKIVLKLFSIYSNDRILKIDISIRKLSKILENNEKDKCDKKISSDGKKYLKLLKENSRDSDTTLLLAAVIYRLYFSETDEIDGDRIDLNKSVNSMEYLKDFIEKCLQEFCWNMDKTYSSDNYYLEVKGEPEQTICTRIHIRFPDRNEAIKKAQVINKVLKLSDSKKDLVTVAVDKKQLAVEQDFFFTLLEEMIQYKKGESNGKWDNPRNVC